MAILGANTTSETSKLLSDILKTDEFERFARINKVNLSDNTVLFRLALINLINNPPTHDQVYSYKAALIRPTEFDDYLERQIQKEVPHAGF